MDQEFENGIFSQFQRESMNQGLNSQSLLNFEKYHLDESLDEEHIILRSRLPSEEQSLGSLEFPIIKQLPNSFIKAYNPMEMVEKMTPQKQLEYLRIANNSKNFNGLQFFFSADDFGSQDQKNQSFLSGINEEIFNSNHQPKSRDMQWLFSSENHQSSQKQHIKEMIISLKSKMEDSQQKAFNSIMLNKTIGPAFYEHFQNFSYVSNPVNFLQDLEINLVNFINHAKRFKTPGQQLISSIYDFWMKTFKDFVNEIWKYSSKFTLNCFKKQKKSQVSDHSNSQSSSKREQTKQSKQKRKNWNSDQIRILQKIIDSNVIFSQAKLKQLSQQFGRSVNSISSKIQKIIKSKKGDQYQEDSLLKKTIQVLKLSPEGLIKDSIIQKINQYYQMGYDGQWQKSVGQLLSSRKQFNKIKGKYRLRNGQKFDTNSMEEQQNDKLTFRDKVIKCFLKFPNYQAELKGLIEMYTTLYGEQQAVGSNYQQRKKSIQASISKTLSRYDIFDTSNSKTIYQYQETGVDSYQKSKDYQESYEDMLNL